MDAPFILYMYIIATSFYLILFSVNDNSKLNTHPLLLNKIADFA